ncbi:MAG TPA: deoxyribodipyrimidine photolyase, partial [Bacillota bacterium]|nr:deoxyribodipyrimidine photolyase [Bacillota bacterium]
VSRVKIIYESKDIFNQVLYLMTKSFRIRNNYTLYEALKEADHLNASLFVLIIPPIEEHQRNKDFFIENTSDLTNKLIDLGCESQILSDRSLISEYIKSQTVIYIDKAYLREDRRFFEQMKKISINLNDRLIEVDSNVFQPTEMVSDKEEYSARTIRDKIWRHFIGPLVLMNENMCLGETKALKLLDDFVNHGLSNYDQRNDPANNHLSGLSPYLKYGFISPNVIYDLVSKTNHANAGSFLEELIVRRELAYNFVLYNQNYDRFDHMTYGWAYQTMSVHIDDPRKYIYSLEDYIQFKTHDPYFNTAMKEMVLFGRMHSYMRMYWCKKLIEWAPSYEEAYKQAIYLNNHYFLDGNTPNGYAGVAWCFGKHDRAWPERPIFGKLRYMNANGLKHKFDIEKYIERIEKEILEGIGK